MAELATVARPYANALFGASKDALEVTNEWLQNIAGLAARPEVQSFVGNPNVGESQVLELFQKGLPTALPEQGEQFLRVLVKNKRVAALPEIAEQFKTLKNNAAGAAEALVTSAFEMNATQRKELAKTLEKRFGKKLTLKVEVDESLIGGVRVQVGDEVLDASVQARLSHLKRSITE